MTKTDSILEFTPTIFINMFKQASKYLDEHAEFLDKINVFPVPDGDTGTNMAYTLRMVRNKLEESSLLSLDDVQKAVIRNSLMYSRGNSGTAISQYFKGFCENITSKNGLTPKILTKCFKNANDTIYKSFQNPVKGTILDVAKAAYKGAKGKSVVEIFETALECSQEALDKTRKTNPIMKKAKVVDSGAAGLVFILTGFLSALKDTDIVITENNSSSEIGIIKETVTFRYCTECVIENPTINEKEMRKKIKKMGDSLQVMQVDNLIKLHIHTDKPEQIKRIAEEVGQIRNFKADDLIAQQKDNIAEKHHFIEGKKNYTIITDSSIDIVNSWINSPDFIVPLQVFTSQNPDEDLAKLSKKEFYEKMELDKNFTPKTSQPTTQSFLETFEKANKSSENIICFTISSGLSGTYQSALNAKKLLKNSDNIHIIDTKSISAGTTLLVEEFEKEYNKTNDIQKALAAVRKHIKKIKIFLLVDDISYLERSGRISKGVSVIGKILNINPLLTVKNGKIENTKDKILFSNIKKKIKLSYKGFKSNQDNNSKLCLLYTGKKGKQIVEKVKNKIQDNNKSLDIQVVELTTLVGTHIGPGSIGMIFK